MQCSLKAERGEGGGKGPKDEGDEDSEEKVHLGPNTMVT